MNCPTFFVTERPAKPSDTFFAKLHANFRIDSRVDSDLFVECKLLKVRSCLHCHELYQCFRNEVVALRTEFESLKGGKICWKTAWREFE